MNEKNLKVLLDANAVKKLRIIVQGSCFHVEIETCGGSKIVMTGKGDLRLWRSIESCAKWVRRLGIGQPVLDLERWQAEQRWLV